METKFMDQIEEMKKDKNFIPVDHADLTGFLGHFVPGLVFILFGLWGIYRVYYRYFMCLKEAAFGKKDAREYESTLLFGFFRFPGIPVEGMLGVIASTAGFIIEYTHYKPVGYALHNLLYIAFGLSASIDILGKYNSAVPKHTEYYGLMVALWANSMLLYSHTKHHGIVDATIHIKLLLICVLGIFALFLESQQHKNALPAIARNFLGCFLGTWYVTIGQVLHPITGEVIYENNPQSVMALEIIFVMEMLGLLIVCLLLGIFVHYQVKKMSLENVSAALDIDFLSVKKMSIFPQEGISSDKGKYQPLLTEDGDSNSGSCC